MLERNQNDFDLCNKINLKKHVFPVFSGFHIFSSQITLSISEKKQEKKGVFSRGATTPPSTVIRTVSPKTCFFAIFDAHASRGIDFWSFSRKVPLPPPSSILRAHFPWVLSDVQCLISVSRNMHMTRWLKNEQHWLQKSTFRHMFWTNLYYIQRVFCTFRQGCFVHFLIAGNITNIHRMYPGRNSR